MVKRLQWHRGGKDYRGFTWYEDSSRRYELSREVDYLDDSYKWFVYRQIDAMCIGIEKYIDDAKYVAELHAHEELEPEATHGRRARNTQ